MISYRKFIENSKKKKKGIMLDPSYIATDRKDQAISDNTRVSENLDIKIDTHDINSMDQFRRDHQNKAMRTKKAKKNDERPDHSLVILRAKKILKLKEERIATKRRLNHFTITDFLGATKYRNITKAHRKSALGVLASQDVNRQQALRNRATYRKKRPLSKQNQRLTPNVKSQKPTEFGYTTRDGSRYYASFGKEPNRRKTKLKSFVEFGKRKYSDSGEKISQHSVKFKPII